MLDRFVWDDGRLRGPLKLIVGQKLVLPQGPPQSAPFDSGKWALSMITGSDGSKLHKWWSSEVTKAPDLILRWEVFCPNDLKNPRPIDQSDNVGSQLRNFRLDTCANAEAYQWNVDEHVAASSEFLMAVECPSMRRHAVEEATSVLKRVMASPIPFDVSFVFDDDDKQVRTSSKLLKHGSPFFKALLKSSDDPQDAELDEAPSDITDDDSNQSADVTPPAISFVATRSVGPLAGTATWSVKVVGVAPVEVEAVIFWIANKYVPFQAQLASIDEEPPRKRGRTGRVTLDSAERRGLPRLPWQAVYELAQFLGIKRLAGLAVAEFAACVTVETVGAQLLSSLALANRDVGKVALDFAVANWAAVQDTEGFKTAKAEVENSKNKSGLQVLKQLAKRV